MENNFVEKRQYHRLPFTEKLLLTDEKKALVGGALNLSRGGLFLKTLNPFPIDSEGLVSFMLPGQEKSISFRAKVVHLVFDRQRAEVDCGMGLQFVEIEKKHQALLDDFLDKEKTAYLALNEVLKDQHPSYLEINRYLEQLHHLRGTDLSELRYRVARICTIFEAPLSQLQTSSGGKK